MYPVFVDFVILQSINIFSPPKHFRLLFICFSNDHGPCHHKTPISMLLPVIYITQLVFSYSNFKGLLTLTFSLTLSFYADNLAHRSLFFQYSLNLVTIEISSVKLHKIRDLACSIMVLLVRVQHMIIDSCSILFIMLCYGTQGVTTVKSLIDGRDAYIPCVAHLVYTHCTPPMCATQGRQLAVCVLNTPPV